MNCRVRFAASVAVMVGGLGSVAACGSAAPAGGAGSSGSTTPTVAAPAGERSFLAKSGSEVVFVRWTDNSGTLSGGLDQVDADQTTSTGTRDLEVSFTGLRHGDDVSLTLSQGLGTYSSLTGKISGDELHLAVPQPDGQLADLTLPPGSTTDYNAAVAALVAQASAAAKAQSEAQRQASADAQAAAARAALDKAVTDADSSFATDLASVREAITTLAAEDLTFRDPLKEIAAAVSQTRKDFAATKRDAQASSPDCMTVSSDDSAVNSDESAVEQGQSNLQSATSTVQSEEQQVTDALKQAKDDLTTLQQAVAADPSGPTPSHHDADLSTARRRASAPLKRAKKATPDALSTAATDVQTAKHLNSQADTFNSRCTN